MAEPEKAEQDAGALVGMLDGLSRPGAGTLVGMPGWVVAGMLVGTPFV